MRAKYLVAMLMIVIILALLLFTSITLLPKGDNQYSQFGSKAYWRQVAMNAWEYFQPGKGVDAKTGLHSAALGWPYFTDWDLGVYIQTIIDAKKIGILSSTGDWGSDARLDKILTFLENRELTADRLPFWWYEAGNGSKWGEGAPDVIDSGKLLVALNNLRLSNPDLAERVNHLVYDRVNYTSLWKAVDGLAGSKSIYGFYVASGFACFWPERFSSVAEELLSSIVSAPKAETYGVALPMSQILCDPLLSSVFDLKPDSRLLDLAKQVILAHEARYKATGKFVAFSEGNTGLEDPSYVYEWVITPSGKAWVVRGQGDSDVQLAPIIYFKVAVGFLAISDTGFAQRMVGFLEVNIPPPENGYMDGVDENGRVISMFIDKTNGLIVSAARYAIQNNALGGLALEKGDLSVYPQPFIQDGVTNNTAIIIGESKPHAPVGAAQTVDAVGAMLITGRLARESSSGALTAALDSWMIKYDTSTKNFSLLDKATNLIIVGSPEINALSYYYNSLRNRFDEPLVPVLFVTNSAKSNNYLYVPSSGSTYKPEVDEQGKAVADYGVIMSFKDNFGRFVALVYGLGADGTLGACQVLRDYDLWNLTGSAVIVKFHVDPLNNFPSNSSIVEIVP